MQILYSEFGKPALAPRWPVSARSSVDDGRRRREQVESNSARIGVKIFLARRSRFSRLELVCGSIPMFRQLHT